MSATYVVDFDVACFSILHTLRGGRQLLICTASCSSASWIMFLYLFQLQILLIHPPIPLEDFLITSTIFTCIFVWFALFFMFCSLNVIHLVVSYVPSYTHIRQFKYILYFLVYLFCCLSNNLTVFGTSLQKFEFSFYYFPTGWMTGFDSQQGQGFSLCHCVQTSSRSHPVS
jgi:hypothetical protein